MFVWKKITFIGKRIALSFLITLLLMASSPFFTSNRANADYINIPNVADADKLLIVDCLLPGSIRQMGTRLTMLTARRAIKTSGADCERRGGEYVPADRANAASALNVWKPLAEAGDRQAQTYVGEIYEKGMGTAPNYQQAVQWYTQAANKGDARAKTNLGNLSERGQGVARNPAQAINLYGDASRLGRSYSTAEPAAPPPQARKPSTANAQAVAEAKQALEQERRAALQQQAEVEKLKRQAQAAAAAKKKEADLLAKQKRIREAEAELAEVERAKASGKEPVAKPPAKIASAADAPKIEILSPPISAMRSIGKPKIQVSEEVGNPLTLRGRVSPVQEIAKLSLNGKSIQYDKQGGFSASLPVNVSGTEVRVSAANQQGQSTDFSFILLPPETAGNTAAADAPTDKASVSGVNFGRYYALVIGNQNYAGFPALATSVNDARAVAGALESRYGFRTAVLENATRSKMLAAFDALRNKLQPQDNLLIYYAGHGELAGGSGYWLPVDARKGDTKSWVSNAQVTNFVDAIQAKHVLVVADSCYSGTLSQSAIPRLSASSGGKSREWYEAVAKTKVRVVLSSGGVRPVMDGGGGKHSVFGAAFLKALNAGGTVLEGARIFRRLKGQVSSAAGAAGIKQTPQFAPIRFAGHEAGDFVFLKDGRAVIDGNPEEPGSPGNVQRTLLAIWEKSVLKPVEAA
ncbi:peptidase C14 caspase catalytic subunit p20 [Thiothrix nivea DSM 5205]|uniref:Peptidase C14 caspase catalytic subunit p20 n=1 Tax=Thiothrix nivea (strain ATCC 35100 / DSM 5205 / JP2) TaxID=870187 RepID=A0A656HGU2_THINJ|nr:peptidase C14 caspase catalytic subunit p20 [Thiothrix nivea DSM 5205]